MGRPVAKPRTLSRARTPARANSAVVLCHPALSGAASFFKRASANRALCTPRPKVGTSSSGPWAALTAAPRAPADRPRPYSLLDPERRSKVPRGFIDHWAYCILGTDRSKWNVQPAMLHAAECAYVTDEWWGANQWPGARLGTPTLETCGTCGDEKTTSCPTKCCHCEEFTCAACRTLCVRCACCHEYACPSCAEENFLVCYWCDARVCSTCAQDWLRDADNRADAAEPEDDDNYVCDACY